MEKMGKILFERYELGRLLGQGNFAKVYYAKKISDGQTVAIKVIDKEKISKVGLDVQIKREITAMKLLRHPNILQVHEVMASKGSIYIVLEYAKGGELFAKVARGRLREDTVRRLFQQLISAVESCHGRGVFHRDLKLENMLLDESGNLKVSDFGLTALVDSARQDCSLQTICGTPAYVAPEVISRKGYDGAKSDIWSCGVILFAMLAGYLPFRDSNLMEMYKKIRKAEYRCPNWFPPEVRKLLAKILDPNPRTRISIAKIMDNPWFRKGLGTRTVKHEEVVETGQEQQDGSGISSIHNEVDRVSGLTTQEIKGLQNRNAFDIISLSSGFDLSGLFVEDEQREDVRFTSQQPASVIIARLEEIAGMFSLKVLKKDGGFFRLSSGSGEGGGRDDTMLDVEIFEFAPSFHLVEMKKSGGDSFEYQKMLRQKIKPALQDIVWAWHGDRICNPCEPLEA